VVSEWQSDFMAFLAHIGPSPGPGYSVDRIDVHRGYEPGNVRWATASQQANNRRNTTWVTIDGERMAFADACRKYQIDPNVVRARIRLGWDLKTALSRAVKSADRSADVL
jgi:hypothetical protein